MKLLSKKQKWIACFLGLLLIVNRANIAPAACPWENPTGTTNLKTAPGPRLAPLASSSVIQSSICKLPVVLFTDVEMLPRRI